MNMHAMENMERFFAMTVDFRKRKLNCSDYRTLFCYR